MSSHNLITLIQNFLDAELLLARLHDNPHAQETQENRLGDTRRRLEHYLATTPHAEVDLPLAHDTCSYLEASAAFDEARRLKQDITLPSRQLYLADVKLQDSIYTAVRAENNGQRLPGEMRLLVAIKDGASSDRALYTAIHMAEHLPARLKLIHVVAPESALATPPQHEHKSREMQLAVELLASKQAEVPAEIACEMLARQGDVSQEIVSAARRWGADFIVMGLHGCGRVSPVLSADHVASALPLASCPVIVVGQTTVPTAKSITFNAVPRDAFVGA